MLPISFEPVARQAGTFMEILLASPTLALDALETLASGLDHPEGICLAPDGALFVSGEAGQIYRIGADGTPLQVAATGGWTLGLAADGEGRIYACDPARREVLRWSPSVGLEVVSTGATDRPFVTPNWGAFGPDGTFYVSDSGGWKKRNGVIVAIRPGGLTEVWTVASVDFPNGLAVSPDGHELWVLESAPGRLVRFRIEDDGRAGERELLAEFPGTVPDGIAFAADGSVVIACYRPDVILRWRADLGIEVLAHDPEGTVLAAPTNCAFHGPDLEEIAVPNFGRWHVANFRVDGLVGTPLSYPTAKQLGG